MSATEGKKQQPHSRPKPQSYAVPGVSMRDLLASCAAARTISTPPRLPDAPVQRSKAA